MIVAEVEHDRMKRGLPCPACGKAVPPTDHYKATCPHCGQLITAKA